MLDVIGYQDKGYKGQCLDCGLDIYAQKFDKAPKIKIFTIRG